MDKDLKTLIDETITNFFGGSLDVCNHCKKVIRENREYTEDGGITWRHMDCKGLIRENLPVGGEDKYIKQEPGGDMMAANTTTATWRENVAETKEVQILSPTRDSKFFGGECRFHNKTNMRLKVTCHKFMAAIGDVQQSAYYFGVEEEP